MGFELSSGLSPPTSVNSPQEPLQVQTVHFAKCLIFYVKLPVSVQPVFYALTCL